MPRRTQGSGDTKALHLEYLVTRQLSTGNGALYIPQVHEGAADDDQPPARFTVGELGCAVDSDANVFTTTRLLALKNGNAKAEIERKRKDVEDRARAEGVKVQPRTWDAGHDEFDHHPVKRYIRADKRQRQWTPSNPNVLGRVCQRAMDRETAKQARKAERQAKRATAKRCASKRCKGRHRMSGSDRARMMQAMISDARRQVAG